LAKTILNYATHESRDDEVHLVENSIDSLVRFSICKDMSMSGVRCTKEEHKRHFELYQLISFDLLVDRLPSFPGWESFHSETERVRWVLGAVEIQLEDNGAIYCYFLGNAHSLMSSEVCINALLSPLKDWQGEAAFARRYSKFLQSVKAGLTTA
jgi:hypothetical protein